jgi:indolepyruvate ferredoxin oxidoreductase
VTAERLPAAIAIASLPEKIRGFGHVKAASVELYQEEVRKAMESYSSQRTDSDAESNAEFNTEISVTQEQRLTA